MISLTNRDHKLQPQKQDQSFKSVSTATTMLSNQRIIRSALLFTAAILVCFVCVGPMAVASGQIADANAAVASVGKTDQKTELGIRQQLVYRKMVELEAKFTIVAEKIRKKNPERAELLVKTYQQSKERSLTKKMDEVSQLLNDRQYDAAEKNLDEVVEILEGLIRLLSNDKEKKISVKEEIAQLEEFKRQIEHQLQKQREQFRETEKASNKEQASEKVNAQINAVKNLIAEQQKLIEDTSAKENANLNQLDKLANRQFEIRKKTDEIRDNITGQKDSLNKDGSFREPIAGAPSNPTNGQPNPGDAEKKDTVGKAQDGKQPDGGEPGSDGEPGDTDKSADGKQPDKPKGDRQKDGENAKPNGDPSKAGKSGEGQPNENQPGGGQSGENPSGENPSGENPSGENQPQAGGGSGQQPSESKQAGQQPPQPSGANQKEGNSPAQPPQPGQQAIEQSSKFQQRAEEKLGSGKPTDAKRQQERAIDELKDALAELEKEKRRIDSLPPEILEQLAKDQRRNREKTLELIKEMKQAPKSNKANGGEQPKNANQTPGEQAMQDAGDAQQQAADDLDNDDSESAQANQKKAEENMEQALEDLEQRLAQLREETREEKLARLESRFNEMLDRQQTATIMTIEIEDKRSNLGKIRRRDQLLILRLATEELEIQELGQQAYELLLEDGSSVVFPEVVQDLSTELESASRLLQNEKTDQYTQLVQKEIETTIQDLIDALKDAKKKGGGGGGGGGGGKQPLLKKSAELKMLRMRQRRLNRRTKKLELMKDQPAIQAVIGDEIRAAAAQQRKILEMTENIMEKGQ